MTTFTMKQHVQSIKQINRQKIRHIDVRGPGYITVITLLKKNLYFCLKLFYVEIVVTVYKSKTHTCSTSTIPPPRLLIEYAL